MFSGIGFLTLDIMIIIALIVILFIVSLKFEKKFLVKLIIIFYPTTLIYLNLPYVDLNTKGAYAQIGTYLGIFIILFLTIRRNATAKKLYSGFRKMFDGIILSVMAVIQWLTLYYLILPIDQAYSFTLPFSYLFTSTIPFGILMIIPLFGLFITNKSDD